MLNRGRRNGTLLLFALQIAADTHDDYDDDTPRDKYLSHALFALTCCYAAAAAAARGDVSPSFRNRFVGRTSNTVRHDTPADCDGVRERERARADVVGRRVVFEKRRFTFSQTRSSRESYDPSFLFFFFFLFPFSFLCFSFSFFSLSFSPSLSLSVSDEKEREHDNTVSTPNPIAFTRSTRSTCVVNQNRLQKHSIHRHIT